MVYRQPYYNMSANEHKKEHIPQMHAISYLYDNRSNEVCFLPNGFWMFRYSYPGCTLWEHDIEILNVKRINVVKAIYMVRCLSKVKDTIHMTYKQLCEAYNALDPSIKHSIIKHDILLLAHDVFLEYRGEVPYSDDDFETTDYYFVPYTDGDEEVPIVDCYGDIDSYGYDFFDEDEEDLDIDDYNGVVKDDCYCYGHDDDEEDEDTK